MAGGAKSKSKGGGKLPSNQRTLGSFFGATATKPKPMPKPKSSGDESGKAARTSTSSDAAAAAAAVERSSSAAAAAPPDTPGTEPCSPETPAVGASIKKKENNGEKNNKSPADVPAAIGKPSSSSALQDSDDDADCADYADADMMQTPVNKTAFKRLGSGGGSNQKRGDTSKRSGGKRLVIDDSDDDNTGDDDDDDDATSNNRIPKEYSRSPTKFIDRRVAKVFNNERSGEPEIFLGKVTDYTPAADSENKKPFWHVLFDDGDEEDWHWDDLDNALGLYRREGHQLDDAVPGKRKVIDASEDEGEDGATDNDDDDAYRPTDDAGSMEDASSSDLDEVAPKKPARKKVKTASSPSRSKSTDTITAATSSAATDTTASLPSAKRKPEEESGAAFTSSASKKAKPAASTSEPKAKKKSAASGWGMFKRQNSAQIKAGSKSKKKKSTVGRGGAKSSAAIAVGGASTGDKPIRAYEPQNPDLEIISNPQEMFNDMIFEKLTGNDKAILDPLLKVIAGRPLKVATMCSGTESPVLALDMLSNAIEEFYLKHRRDEIDLPGRAEGQPVFQVEHVFSCEIEPFKQSYIE